MNYLILSVILAFNSLSCKREKSPTDKDFEGSNFPESTSDPRIEGQWFVFGFNDLFIVTSSHMKISYGRGNDYPSGEYRIVYASDKGGGMFVLMVTVNFLHTRFKVTK